MRGAFLLMLYQESGLLCLALGDDACCVLILRCPVFGVTARVFGQMHLWSTLNLTASPPEAPRARQTPGSWNRTWQLAGVRARRQSRSRPRGHWAATDCSHMNSRSLLVAVSEGREHSLLTSATPSSQCGNRTLGFRHDSWRAWDRGPRENDAAPAETTGENLQQFEIVHACRKHAYVAKAGSGRWGTQLREFNAIEGHRASIEDSLLLASCHAMPSVRETKTP